MSMALHGSKLAFEQVYAFLQNNISRKEMEQRYTQQWMEHFSKRLQTGRMIQRLFGNKMVTNIFIGMMKPFPKLVNFLIKQTHGKAF
jgi:menaquinone-9 beta-reductase